MKIFYYNGEHVRVVTGDKTIVINPPSKNSKLLNKTKKPADIVISTINHTDFNGIENTLAKDGISINTPGEFEIGDVFIHGVPTESAYKKEDHIGFDNLINVVYTITAEGLNMVFLGALKDKESMNYEAIEDLDSVDILFVPIGGGEVLSAQEAYSLSVSVEAKLIIPIHFSGIGSESALAEFLKEAGKESQLSQEKLTIKRKDVQDMKNEVITIQS